MLPSQKKLLTTQQEVNSFVAKPIAKEYYQNPDVLFLAQDLLGKILHTKIEDQHCFAKIIETEAYKAPEDKASHAHQNLRTKRTEIMFEEGGHAYVYLCYGIHSMVNVVTGPKDCAHAILIRAVEPLNNIELFKQRVITKKKDILLGSGPGNVCKAMGIDTSDNGMRLFEQEKIWIEEGTEKLTKNEIVKSPRVGIAYAKEWAHKPWRFYINNHPSVSKPRIVSYDNSH